MKLKIPKLPMKQKTFTTPATQAKTYKIPYPDLPLGVWVGLIVTMWVAVMVSAYVINPAPANYVFLAIYADIKAGPPTYIDLDQVDYHQDLTGKFWEIQTNSEWLVEQTNLIVPYMGYENLAPSGRYPTGIYFAPMANNQSFHILGKYLPFYRIIIINDRFLYDGRRLERADMLLSTIVHELVHAQHGRYVKGESQELESATEAATIEILAAMCNHNNNLACQAFYNELKGYALTGLELSAPKVFEAGLRLILDGPKDQAPRDKSLRYWASDPAGLDHILTSYIMYPWQQLIKPAAEGWAGFNTGFANYDLDKPVPLVADFDDIRYLLGWVLHLI